MPVAAKVRPSVGLCLLCKLVRGKDGLPPRDGDTLVVKGPVTGLEWAIRIQDCWCPENNTPEGKAATAYRNELLDMEQAVYVHISQMKFVNNLLKNITFDRIPADVYLKDGRNFATLMIQSGHALKTDPNKHQ